MKSGTFSVLVHCRLLKIVNFNSFSLSHDTNLNPEPCRYCVQFQNELTSSFRSALKHSPSSIVSDLIKIKLFLRYIDALSMFHIS